MTGRQARGRILAARNGLPCIGAGGDVVTSRDALTSIRAAGEVVAARNGLPRQAPDGYVTCPPHKANAGARANDYRVCTHAYGSSVVGNTAVNADDYLRAGGTHGGYGGQGKGGFDERAAAAALFPARRGNFRGSDPGAEGFVPDRFV